MVLHPVENQLLQRSLPRNLGYTYLDTGAMYRAATYLALQNDLTEEDVDQLVDLLNQYPVSFGRSEDGQQLVFVADVDVTHPIRMTMK